MKTFILFGLTFISFACGHALGCHEWKWAIALGLFLILTLLCCLASLKKV